MKKKGIIPIIVCTSPRTGSNLLVDSLGRHSQAISAGEWYNEIVEPLVEISRNVPDPLNTCNLFKLFSHDMGKADSYTIIQSGIVVYLYRLDRKAQLASWQKAAVTGNWTQEEKEPPTGYIGDIKAELAIDLAETLFSGVADIIITYETMINSWDFTIESILDLANWKEERLPQCRKKLQ